MDHVFPPQPRIPRCHTQPINPGAIDNTMNTPTNPTNPHIEPSAQAQPATVFITPIRPAIPTTGGTLEVLVRVQAPAQPDD